MRLNIVTDNGERVLNDLRGLFGAEWLVSHDGEIAEGIHDYTLVSKGEFVISVENLLELGIEPHNIRIYG